MVQQNNKNEQPVGKKFLAGFFLYFVGATSIVSPVKTNQILAKIELGIFFFIQKKYN